MILANILISLVICLAAAVDLVMLAHLPPTRSRAEAVFCLVFLLVAYMANMFSLSLHGGEESLILLRQVFVNFSVMVIHLRWTRVLLSLAAHEEQSQLPPHFRAHHE